MRDRKRTIEALRRLAERPGTPQEGETARKLLAQLGAVEWTRRPFDAAMFPRGTRVFYCYWCYRNDPAVIVQNVVKHIGGATWMCLKFDRLKKSRWVPVTSELGCHISLEPFTGNEAETLYRRDVDWAIKDEQFRRECAELGISLRPWNQPIKQIT